MPAKSYWDANEANVYIIEAVAPSTWEEAKDAFMEAFAEIGRVTRPVAIILDASQDPDPPSPQVMTQMRAILASAPDNFIGIVLVGSNALATRMVNILGRVLNRMLISAAADRNEAYERIAKAIRA